LTCEDSTVPCSCSFLGRRPACLVYLRAGWRCRGGRCGRVAAQVAAGGTGRHPLNAPGRTIVLASEAPALAALITAAVAVVGVTLTAIFNQLGRRDADRERKSLALHDASKRLSSKSDPKRAAAMAAVVEHLNHPS